VSGYGNPAAPLYGDASTTNLKAPVVAIEAPDEGGGYWLATSDGGIFSFGDAQFYGSAGNLRLNKPIVGMASTPDGGGYWLVASDGGIFSFGDAPFAGSAAGLGINDAVALVATHISSPASHS
jgi:hypothetical protein